MSAADRACRLVAALTGVDVSAYKDAVLLRRLRARARGKWGGDPEAFLDALEAGGAPAVAEAYAVVASLRVRVSGFFRDPEAFRALEGAAYPALLAKHPPGAPLRVWSVACSRGQEPYSLAMSIADWAEARGLSVPTEVLGTDLDGPSLAVARAGWYPWHALEGLPDERRAAHFEPAEGGWAVGPGLRQAVTFREGDALDLASHPTRCDLIACRNLLIYLKRPRQEELILALGRALKPGGFLFLGPSETLVGRPWRQFEHVDSGHRIYRRAET